MVWPLFAPFLFFFLAKSQTIHTGYNHQDTDSSFSQDEARDCTKTGQGCKGFDQSSLPNSDLQSVMLPLSSKDPEEDRVVLKVKDVEANDLHAAVRVCEQGTNKPECHGEKPTHSTLKINFTHVDSKSAGKVEREEESAEVRHLLLFMVILFASLCIFRCRMSLALLLLGCWVADQIVQWGSLMQCSKPLHAWLLVMYASACALRLAFRAADRYLGKDSDLPWYLRCSKKWGPFPQACMAAWVLVPLPFVVYWSILGISWLNDVLENSPESVFQGGGHAQVSAVVTCLIFNLLVVVAGLVFVLYACVVSRSFAVAGEALNAISDADLVERWGPPQRMLAEDFGSGMAPADIAKLPCDEVPSDCATCYTSSVNCAICLTKIAEHDRIRRLPACKHEFHRPCIDQWLLRMASCPLCLAPVTGGSSLSSSQDSVATGEDSNDMV